VRCLSDARALTARIELGAVCGRLLKYALLLAENHHHFAGFGPPKPIKLHSTLACFELYGHLNARLNQTVTAA